MSLLCCAIGCLILGSGCADTASFFGAAIKRPFTRTPEEKLGIKTPSDRVKELRKQAKHARKQPGAEQEKAVAALAEEIRNEREPWLRREILRTLAEYPQPQAGAVLVAALGDSDADTRVVACAGLGRRADKTAVQELSRVLASDTNVDVRLAAVRALGETKDSGALGPLSEALVDGDPAMQAHAQQALVSVSGKNYGNNVQAWRELAQNGKTEAAELSYAERFRRAFY